MGQRTERDMSERERQLSQRLKAEAQRLSPAEKQMVRFLGLEHKYRGRL